jgi:hypothetical protein
MTIRLTQIRADKAREWINAAQRKRPGNPVVAVHCDRARLQLKNFADLTNAADKQALGTLFFQTVSEIQALVG